MSVSAGAETDSNSTKMIGIIVGVIIAVLIIIAIIVIILLLLYKKRFVTYS